MGRVTGSPERFGLLLARPPNIRSINYVDARADQPALYRPSSCWTPHTRVRSSLQNKVWVERGASRITNECACRRFSLTVLQIVQIIFRNINATFTCHISGSAEFPVWYVHGAYHAFVYYFGPIAGCWVASGDDPVLGTDFVIG